jgi:hypothetical protein
VGLDGERISLRPSAPLFLALSALNFSPADTDIRLKVAHVEDHIGGIFSAIASSEHFMSESTSLDFRGHFSEADASSCRIETNGGTVYWLSQANSGGVRWIVREHLKSSNTNTMVMHKFSKQGAVDLGDKFRGRLGGDVQVGIPFVLEVVDRDTRILSESVVAIEVGNIPEMIFR